MRHDGDRGEKKDLPRDDWSFAPSPIPVPQHHEAGENERENDEGEHSVRPSAAELRRAAERCGDDVDVGKVGPDHHRGRREGGSAAESRAGQRRPDESMADVVHAEMSRAGLAGESAIKQLLYIRH